MVPFGISIWHIYFLLRKKQNEFQKYKEHIDKVNYNGIQFQVKLKDIPKIEKKKMNDMKFNVFSVSEEKPRYMIFPRYISETICD